MPRYFDPEGFNFKGIKKKPGSKENNKNQQDFFQG